MKRHDSDIKDGHTADLYISMLKAVEKIEKTGELNLDDVEYLDHQCWVYMCEEELKQETAV